MLLVAMTLPAPTKNRGRRHSPRCQGHLPSPPPQPQPPPRQPNHGTPATVGGAGTMVTRKMMVRSLT